MTEPATSEAALAKLWFLPEMPILGLGIIIQKG